jgi:cell division protease FtsH
MIFGPEHVTTGASNDIERATDIARNMVTRFGLSDNLGPLAYAEDEGEVFLGRSVTQQRQVSPETAQAIDKEVRQIIDRNYKRAKQMLEDNLEKLHTMAEALLKFETIGKDQIDDIMSGVPMREPDDDAGSAKPSSGTGSDVPRGGAPHKEPPVVGGAVGGI